MEFNLEGKDFQILINQFERVYDFDFPQSCDLMS
jgi:hypothetical protein